MIEGEQQQQKGRSLSNSEAGLKKDIKMAWSCLVDIMNNNSHR